MIKEKCNNALLSVIIKEWGCFARQKVVHRQGVKDAKEKQKNIATD
ncbi:MAG: hypothetical protein H8D23_05975 [Candidatus Brocadiales bacterium]|nr:hypothetical protein [Candidatus Brocadiales bacterium]